MAASPRVEQKALLNFFKSLLNPERRGNFAVSPGAAAGKPLPIGPRTSGAGSRAAVRVSGDSQTGGWVVGFASGYGHLIVKSLSDMDVSIGVHDSSDKLLPATFYSSMVMM